MKKLMISIFTIAAMVSCTSENEIIDNGGKNDEKVEIKMKAGILQTKAVVNGLEDDITDVAFIRAEGSTPNWNTGNLITGVTIAKTSGEITFAAPEYYPTDGSSVNFIGIMPSTGATKDPSSNTITWTDLDGNQDVMYAPLVNGTKLTTKLEPKFSHVLTQISFNVEATSNFDSGYSLESIIIKDAQVPSSLNLSDGKFTYTSQDITITPSTKPTISTTSTAVENSIRMFKAPENNKLKVIVTTKKGDIQNEYPATEIDITAETGTAYALTLQFDKATVAGTATVDKWTEDSNKHTGIIK